MEDVSVSSFQHPGGAQCIFSWCKAVPDQHRSGGAAGTLLNPLQGLRAHQLQGFYLEVAALAVIFNVLTLSQIQTLESGHTEPPVFWWSTAWCLAYVIKKRAAGIWLALPTMAISYEDFDSTDHSGNPLFGVHIVLEVQVMGGAGLQTMEVLIVDCAAASLSYLALVADLDEDNQPVAFNADGDTPD